MLFYRLFLNVCNSDSNHSTTGYVLYKFIWPKSLSTGHWPVVILTTDLLISCLHIQKRRAKNAFYIVINMSFCWFIVEYLIIITWTFSFVIYYTLFSVFSSFFFFLMLVNAHELYKSIEQLYCNLEIPKTKLNWVNGLLSKEVRFKWSAKLYPTYKIKQTKKRKFEMGYSIFSHSH